MRRSVFLSKVGLAALLVAGWGTGAAAQVTLNVVTAGDTNMHDLQRNVFGPEQ